MTKQTKILKISREKMIEGQKKYCDKNKCPFFAPSDGYCPMCRQDIVNWNWIKELITGCPFCHISYCD